MKILVVEDEPTIRMLLGRFLEGEGHAVQTVENGQRGWELLWASQDEFDVVFVDIKMPTLDGRELLRRMREHGVTVPVVLLSRQVNVTNQDAVDAGALCILHKPFELKEIQAVLEDIEKRSQGEPCTEFSGR